MRARFPALLVLASLLAGCSAEPAPESVELRLLALDGRWSFPEEKGAALLARVGAPPPVGALVVTEARAARAVADVVGVDAEAAAALGVGSPPASGEALVARAFAERERVGTGATLALVADAWPAPYVATYFEMERTPPCERRPEAKLCFLPQLEPGTARLRLRADEGARDAAFLPDLVELGPQGRPAWWNGSFTSPSGATTPFLAHASLSGELVPAERPGPMEAGPWTIDFRLETNGRLAAAGAAGIVRVREPGYLWFDDRLQEVADPRAQARAVLANATTARLDVRVARVVDALPLDADVLLAGGDARALAGAKGPTALLANLTATQERALGSLHASDGVTTALRARALPGAAPPGPIALGGQALLFAAPPGLDPATLPAVEGALAPSLALAMRAPVGEPIQLEGNATGGDALLLAHASGPVAWTLPAGARWVRTEDALENLSRSRTLGLASPDLVAAPIATVRVDMGEGNTTRSMVIIGGVVGGPARVVWTSAALVAGAGHPVGARIVLPLAESVDAAGAGAVAERALALWAGHGVVLDR